MVLTVFGKIRDECQWCIGLHKAFDDFNLKCPEPRETSLASMLGPWLQSMIAMLSGCPDNPTTGSIPLDSCLEPQGMSDAL